MGIGYRIKEAREQLGLTQTELGRLVGVTGSAITNYEKETSHPKEQIIYKLMEQLNVDANYLFQDVVKICSHQNDISMSEYNMIKKYRALDYEAKTMVDAVMKSAYEMSEARKPKEGQLLVSSTPGYVFDIVRNGEIIPWVKEDAYENINAAHERTDTPISDTDVKHDEDIMDDDNF